jgi:CHC2-type zinc finger protein
VSAGIDFDSIRARHSLAEYCQKRGVELRRNGGSGELVGLCPLHQEKTGSFHVYPDNHFHCYGCGAHGDVTDLEQGLGGGTRAEAAARLGAERLYDIKRREPPIPRPRKTLETPISRPDLSCLRKASRAELEQIADSREIDLRAVQLAQDMGTLRVGAVCGFPCWALLDSSGLCAEGRRLNRKPYPAITKGKVQLSERKAHTLRGSRKDWPVGIMPAAEYRKSVDAILLVEGGPDYLAALHFALQQRKTGILPVAILGRGQGLRGLHPDSLEHFRGQQVRIVPHDDPDGGSYQAALVWCRQLGKLDCEVDLFAFKGLRKANGERCKDLNDCVELAPEQINTLEELFP